MGGGVGWIYEYNNKIWTNDSHQAVSDRNVHDAYVAHGVFRITNVFFVR